MFPILLRIGNLTLRTYGFFVALGVVVAYNYVKYQAAKKNLNWIFLSNLIFFCVLVGLLGGRLLYVILNFEYYKTNIFSVLKIWEGGLVFYGGFFAGIIFGVIYTLLNKQDLLYTMDILTPALYLGLSIGRIGCFCAGCCYGREVFKGLDFLGIVFTHPESLAPIGIKIFPTQLFESGYAFIIFLITHKLLKKNFLKYRIFFLGGMIYSFFRFLNEFIRGDDRGSLILGLYPSQFISIIIFLLFFILIFYIKKWKKDVSK
ncbi:MAG: prolipoprotein diacylglyceryl transferase [Endomicrobiia bacterium]